MDGGGSWCLTCQVSCRHYHRVDFDGGDVGSFGVEVSAGGAEDLVPAKKTVDKRHACQDSHETRTNPRRHLLLDTETPCASQSVVTPLHSTHASTFPFQQMIRDRKGK